MPIQAWEAEMYFLLQSHEHRVVAPLPLFLFLQLRRLGTVCPSQWS